MIAAAFFLLGVAVGIAFLAAVLAWDRANNTIDVLLSDGEVRS